MNIEAKLTSKGQITIPKKVRKELGLKAGKKVVFIIEGKRAVMLPKVKDPLKRLEELRKELPRITRSEIKEMIKESKKAWD
jgi:AbrB family looped-hinge helix DNA binding protein